MKRVVVGLLLAIAAVVFCLSQPADAQNGDWGTIKGQIVWPANEELPKQVHLDLKGAKDAPHCLTNGKPPLSEDWVVNPKNKGIRWAFVWLSAGPGKPVPIHPDLQQIKEKDVVIDQPVCMFVPHALAMREGQVLVAKNSSQISHNFKWTGDASFDIGGNTLIPAGADLPIKNLKASRIPVIIQCSIHPWMKGWVRVFNHPYFGVTDENGNFEIKDAPAGDYKLIVWHASAGWRGGAAGKDGTPITIAPGMNNLDPWEFTK